MVFNGAQIHMLVNHLPVIGFLGVVLGLLATLFLRSTDVKRFVLAATTVVGLSAIAPFLTGEPAEEVIEDLPGVQKALIHEHEEAAETATVLAVATGVLAGAAFVLSRKRPDTLRFGVPAVLVLSVASAAVMGLAAHEGGKIRHPEIIPGGLTTPAAAGGEVEGHDDDGDD